MANAGFAKWFPWMQGAFRPVTDWFVRGLEPGQQVLDIACGAGLPALATAAAVAPGGRVVATDISAEMIAAARGNADRAGLTNLEVQEMDAQSLRFPDGSFDAVSCAFGIMFCPDPVKAVAEMKRVVRPGGRISIAVWTERERNPFFTSVFGTVAKFGGPGAPSNPDAPGPFRHGPPGALERVLRDAGLDAVTVEEIRVPLEFESIEQYWQQWTDVAPMNVAGPVAALPPDEQARFHATLREKLAPYLTERGLSVPTVARCARATVGA